MSCFDFGTILVDVKFWVKWWRLIFGSRKGWNILDLRQYRWGIGGLWNPLDTQNTKLQDKTVSKEINFNPFVTEPLKFTPFYP